MSERNSAFRNGLSYPEVEILELPALKGCSEAGCKKIFSASSLRAGRMFDPAEAAKEGMMGKVVPIDRGRFLGDYISRQEAPKIVGNGLFVFGVVVTIVVPQIVYCAIGDPVTPWVFVVTAQAGVIAGLVKYIRRPAALPSVVGTQIEPTSQGDKSRRRKAS